jgi:hypothetical protein
VQVGGAGPRQTGDDDGPPDLDVVDLGMPRQGVGDQQPARTSAAVVARTLAAASSSAASSMSAITTRMPSAAKRSARPRPIPLAAPVTTAAFPLRSSMSATS